MRIHGSEILTSRIFVIGFKNIMTVFVQLPNQIKVFKMTTKAFNRKPDNWFLPSNGPDVEP